MILAHRSVELVCAFMGILASGATVTVLDPLYPPQRQQLYLEVSRPKALISISKAVEENGPLAPLVQKYIEEELSLKAFVPHLRLEDDGILFGGSNGNVDLFDHVRGKAVSPPHVLVGPDSNPTLGFTSGSEGKPKAVLGRHYGLTRYFPFMANRFNLSSNSVFACLSGIAHDPIQRG